MASVRAGIILRHIRQLIAREGTGELSDRDLLHRFSELHDEEAFATLMRRHGSMVFGVCRRVVRSVHDAEDTCQAVFLVLAPNAGSFGWHHSVAPLLDHGACRLAPPL